MSMKTMFFATEAETWKKVRELFNTDVTKIQVVGNSIIIFD